MGGAIPKLVDLGSIRKQAEQARESKPVSSTLHGLCVNSCSRFLPCLSSCPDFIFLKIYLFIVSTIVSLHVHLHTRRGCQIPLQMAGSHHVVVGN